MPYFKFTSKFVLSSGGTDKYQASFLEMVNMAAPDMAKNHVYLYVAPSREVYMTRIVHVRLMKTFKKFATYLTPIKRLSHCDVTNIKESGAIVKHLKYILPDTVAVHRFHSSGHSQAIYCENTGAKIVVFKKGGVKIYHSQHFRKIHDSIERFLLLVEKEVILLDKDSLEEIASKLDCNETHYNDVELAEYQKIKRAMEIITKHSEIFTHRYLLGFKQLFHTKPLASALSELFIPITNDLKDAATMAGDECYIIKNINSLTHSHYPVPVYHFDQSGLMRNGKRVVCLSVGSTIETPLLENCQVDGEKISYMGIPVIEAEAADEFVSVADQK